MQKCPAFHGLLNAFIELDGHVQHRFGQDPVFGEIMARFRDGRPTKQDIELLNKNCCITNTHRPTPNIPVAVYRNRNRDAINCAQFEYFCERNRREDPTVIFEGALLIFMDQLQMRDGVKSFVPVTSNEAKSIFYQRCGENACKTGDMTSGRVDPVLKLFRGCRMMLTENKDVPNGQANGSRLKVLRVNIKVGEEPVIVQLSCGTKVRAYFASQVASITVRHEFPDITPQEFQVTSKLFTFSATVCLSEEMRTVQMKGSQFPLVSNGVTTGHKLQGCTLERLAIFEFFYGSNWVYVTLSRVRTMTGLYLSAPLSTDVSKYSMSQAMKNMISSFQKRIGLEMYDLLHRFVGVGYCHRM